MNDQQEEKAISMNTETTLSNDIREPGFWREILHQIRLVFYLIRDPEVPFYLKLLPFVGFVYLLFPIDLIPDVAPVLGQLDDLTILLVGSKIFIELAPPHVVAKHRRAIRERDGFITAAEEKEGPITIIVDEDNEVIIPKSKQE